MTNQIEEIQKLYAKKKVYKIPKEPKEGEVQIYIEITPLSLEDMGSLDMREGMSNSEVSKNVTTMFAASLKLEESEVSKISFKHMKDILAAVMDANDFQEEDMKKTGLKEFMANKKKQMEEKK